MRKALLVGGLLGWPAVVGVSHEIPKAIFDHDPRFVRLQEFFGQRDCPLREAAADFLIAADENALDWRLLPSISIIESSGGKDYRNNNVFGWDSCKEKFSSVRAGIHFVAAQLGKSRRYKDKDIDSKLQLYNPLPEYGQKVKAVMRSIGSRSQPRLVAAD